MAIAQCKFTQGATVGGDGQSVFGFVANTVVSMTDAGGAGATSYLWEMVSWPAPLASAPVITNSTSLTATVTPTLDGVYIIKLTRTEGVTVTTDTKFFGVVDEDGLVLPSAGQTGNMTNQSANTAKAGWAGRNSAGTHFQIDAYLRYLKARAGKVVGKVGLVSHTASTAVVTQIADTDPNFRVLSISGVGTYTEDLLSPPATTGKRVRYLVAISSGAGTFTVRNGAGGSSIFSIPAPPLGTVTYDLEFVYTGSAWVLTRCTVAAPLAMSRSRTFFAVAGRQSTNSNLPVRVGSVTIDTTTFPPNTQYTFTVQIESTSGKIAEATLYNVTDGAYVGSAMTSGLQIASDQTQVVTLASGLKTYEVYLRMTVIGGALDQVTCTSAKIVGTWG